MSEQNISRGVVILGRVGLAARGIVYLVIGVLAAMAALGIGGGKVVDQREAVRTLGDSPFGDLVLWIVGLGLASYALWRFSQVLTGAGASDDAKRWRKRVVALVSGIAYAGLSITAFAQALGRSRKGGGSSSQQEGAEWLLSQPFGRWLVVIIGLIILGAAIFQFTRMVTASFAKHLQGGSLTAEQERWTRRAGRAGFGARGVAFTLIGWFFLQAGWNRDASEAGGLSAALETLAAQGSGPILLAIVGAGLAFFGVYSLIEARYRRIG